MADTGVVQQRSTWRRQAVRAALMLAVLADPVADWFQTGPDGGLGTVLQELREGNVVAMLPHAAGYLAGALLLLTVAFGRTEPRRATPGAWFILLFMAGPFSHFAALAWEAPWSRSTTARPELPTVGLYEFPRGWKGRPFVDYRLDFLAVFAVTAALGTLPLLVAGVAVLLGA